MDKKIEINEIKKIQLEILKDVHSFCRLNNINYFLTYGTLIGAIRHNGYIPWDDDIDIAMPRPDYNKFIDKYKSLNYKIICFQKDSKYPGTFAKVTDNRTSLIEKNYPDFDFGINIDVFPIDGLPDNLKKSNMFFYKLYVIKCLRETKKRKLKIYDNKRIRALLIIGKICLFFIKLSTLTSYSIKLMSKYNYEKSNYVADLNCGDKSRKISKQVFSSFVLHRFEDDFFYIPVGYDKYLKNIYGDYMKLPPEDKRKPMHQFVAFKK